MANTSVVVERRIAAPQAAVWDALTDLENAPKVLSGVDAVEVLSPARSASAPGGARPGA